MPWEPSSAASSGKCGTTAASRIGNMRFRTSADSGFSRCRCWGTPVTFRSASNAPSLQAWCLGKRRLQTDSNVFTVDEDLRMLFATWRHSQLGKDGLHCRIVSLVVRTWLREMSVEWNEVGHLRHIKQRLPLHAAFYLVGTQQFGSFGSYSITLRLGDASFSMIGK